MGDAEVDACATSTSADGGLDAGGHGSKDEKEKDAPNVRRERGRIEWRASDRRRMSIPKARRTSMAMLESRDGTASVKVGGKVNQQFSSSSCAACAGQEVAYFDFIEVGLSSSSSKDTLCGLSFSSSNGILVGVASPASNVLNTAATSAESRETKKVVIEPTSIPSLKGKQVSKSSPQLSPPPAYSTTFSSVCSSTLDATARLLHSHTHSHDKNSNRSNQLNSPLPTKTARSRPQFSTCAWPPIPLAASVGEEG